MKRSVRVSASRSGPLEPAEMPAPTAHRTHNDIIENDRFVCEDGDHYSGQLEVVSILLDLFQNLDDMCIHGLREYISKI